MMINRKKPPVVKSDAAMLHMACAMAVLCYIPVRLANAQPADMNLQNSTFSSTQTFTATNSITAGPDFTVTATGDATLNAPNVAIKPRFYVLAGGRLYVVSQTIIVNVKDVDAEKTKRCSQRIEA